MSIAGYFGREVRQLRMPKRADEAGIQYEGNVLRGERSVEEARAVEGLAFKTQSPMYGDVEEYDPVLWWHCRL